MSPLPRALHRARLWTVGALSASTLLVGAIGVHLADAQTQTVAASTSGTSSSTSNSSSSSDDTSSSTSQSGTSSSDTSSSDTSSSDTSSSDTSGFSAVSPVDNSNGQAQTSSGGS